jgi:hypothetical protein
MSGVFLGNVEKIGVVSVTIDANVTVTNTTQETDVTVYGVRVGDVVFVSKPSHSTGIGILNVRVKAADTVSITYGNLTGSGVDPASETYLLCIIRPDRTITSASF